MDSVKSEDFENDSLEESDECESMEMDELFNDNNSNENDENEFKNNQLKNKNPFLNNKSLKVFPTGIMVKNTKRERILDYRYLIKMKNSNFGRMKIKEFKEAKKLLEMEKNAKYASKINVGFKMNNIKNQLKILWNKVEEIDGNNTEFIKLRSSIPNFGTPVIDCTIEEDSLEENSSDSLENLPALMDNKKLDENNDFIKNSMTVYQHGTKIVDYSGENNSDSLENDSLDSSKEEINSSEKSENNCNENKQDDDNVDDEENDIKLKIYKKKNENNIDNAFDPKKQPSSFKLLCQVNLILFIM